MDWSQQERFCFLEAQNVSLAVQSRRQARAVQQHQCQQRVYAGTITGWVLGQERG